MQLDYTTKFSDDDRVVQTRNAGPTIAGVPVPCRTVPRGTVPARHGFTDDNDGVTSTGDVFRGTVSLALEKKLGFKGSNEMKMKRLGRKCVITRNKLSRILV
jgi:hypothetical protein